MMNRCLLTAHWLVGVLGLLAFVLTGQYMHWFLDHLQGMASGPRMMYRSAHIYLLWSSLLNIMLGCYGDFSLRKVTRAVQVVAGLALMVAPPLLLASFFAESRAAALVRPMASAAIYICLGAVLLHTGGHYLGRTRK